MDKDIKQLSDRELEISLDIYSKMGYRRELFRVEERQYDDLRNEQARRANEKSDRRA